MLGIDLSSHYFKVLALICTGIPLSVPSNVSTVSQITADPRHRSSIGTYALLRGTKTIPIQRCS